MTPVDAKNLEPKFKIEFLKAWGHPTKNEIYGPPQVVFASSYQAERLVFSGYAKLLPYSWRGDHFCPDWDDMLICKEDPEWESCTCREIRRQTEDNKQ